MKTAEINSNLFYSIKEGMLAELSPSVNFDNILLKLEENFKCKKEITSANYVEFYTNPKVSKLNLIGVYEFEAILMDPKHFLSTRLRETNESTKIYLSTFEENEVITFIEKNSDKIELLFKSHNMAEKFKEDFDDSYLCYYKRSCRLFNKAVKTYAYLYALHAFLAFCGISDSFKTINNKLFMISNNLSIRQEVTNQEYATFEKCKNTINTIRGDWNEYLDIKCLEFDDEDRNPTVDDLIDGIKEAYNALSKYIAAYTNA